MLTIGNECLDHDRHSEQWQSDGCEAVVGDLDDYLVKLH